MKITKKCKHCKREFNIAQGEYNFFQRKGFKLPNLCKVCRDKRKNAAYVIEGKVLDGIQYEKYLKTLSTSS